MHLKAFYRNIGAWITSRFADHVDVTAAGAGDAAESDGVWVQRPDGAESAKLVISWEATLAATETLSLAANVQDATSSGGAGAADYAENSESLAATVVATGEAGGSTERGTTELDVDLSGANEYVRSQITPNLSASGTDTARVHAVWIFGSTKIPAS